MENIIYFSIFLFVVYILSNILLKKKSIESFEDKKLKKKEKVNL